MGRVNKYKKIKAVDPFSKRRSAEDTSKYDLPPDLPVQSKIGRKRKDLSWDEEGDREVLLQREGRRVLRNQDGKVELHVEGKRTEETMKTFKERVRVATRTTLRDELKSMTASAKKRKVWLKEKSAKKKLKTSKSSEEQPEFNEEFSMSVEGRIRASDKGAPSSFPRADNTVHGIVAPIDRPLDIRNFVDKKHKHIVDVNRERKKGISLSAIQEMEQMRQRTQEAYAALKAKRRAEPGYKSFISADRI